MLVMQVAPVISAVAHAPRFTSHDSQRPQIADFAGPLTPDRRKIFVLGRDPVPGYRVSFVPAGLALPRRRPTRLKRELSRLRESMDRIWVSRHTSSSLLIADREN